MRDVRNLGVVGLAVVAMAGSACTGEARHGGAGARSGAPSVIASASPSTGSSPKVPNPFTVIARYSAASLGLKPPIAALAIGPAGDLDVADESQRVSVVSPAGRVLRRWGGHGPGPGQFSFVDYDAADPSQLNASIAVGPDGTVYVADTGDTRVEVFSPTGAFIRQFGAFGLKDGQFLQLGDLSVDSEGNVFVSDWQAQTLSKFSPTGRFRWSIGGSN